MLFRELHLEDIGSDNITLWKQREAYLFERTDDTTYEFDGETMYWTSEGSYHIRVSYLMTFIVCKHSIYVLHVVSIISGIYHLGVFIYLFDSSSGKLLKVSGYFHNVTLDLMRENSSI